MQFAARVRLNCSNFTGKSVEEHCSILQKSITRYCFCLQKQIRFEIYSVICFLQQIRLCAGVEKCIRCKELLQNRIATCSDCITGINL